MPQDVAIQLLCLVVSLVYLCTLHVFCFALLVYLLIQRLLLQVQKQQESAALAAMQELLLEEEQSQAKPAAKKAKKDKQKATKKQAGLHTPASPGSGPDEGTEEEGTAASSANGLISTIPFAATTGDEGADNNGAADTVPSVDKHGPMAHAGSGFDQDFSAQQRIAQQLSAQQQRSSRQSMARQSTAQHGASRQGASKQGSAKQASAQKTAPQQRPAQQAPAQQGPPQQGPAQTGSAQRSTDAGQPVSVQSPQQPKGKCNESLAHRQSSKTDVIDEAELQLLLSCPLTKVRPVLRPAVPKCSVLCCGVVF